jgi:MFS family permease
MIQNFTKKITQENLILGLFFALGIFFSYNTLHTNLRDLNLWDESVYINTGRTFFSGTLTPFFRNPLIGMLYAITYLPFQSSPYWLVQSATLGRFILFALLWLSALLISKQTVKFASPYIMAGFLLIYPITTGILNNPSDSLFAAMSGFALRQVLSYYNTQNIKHVWLASLFIGLSALSRNDGLVSFAILCVLILWLSLRFKSNWKWVPALLLPFALILGGYQTIYGLRTGHYELGTTERSYVAFQQGQELVYKKDPNCTLKRIRCAVLQADQLYGTPEQNNFSVLRAISNNPKAYSERFLKHLETIPKLLVTTYGQRTVFLLLILALRGLYELFRKREYSFIILLIVWISYLGVYFLTFFREGYVRTPFFIFYLLGAIGVQAIAENASNKKERNAWLMGAGGFTILALILNVQVMYFTAALLLLAFIFISALNLGQPAQVWALLLVIALMLRPAYDPPVYEARGVIPEEQGVLALSQMFPENSNISAGAPGAVWMARMTPMDVADYDYENATTPEAFYQQLKKDKVVAIYVDPYLSNANKQIWLLIFPKIGSYYEKAYASKYGGDIQVLIVK